MSHQVWRLIAEKINNKPLLVLESQLDNIIGYLENRDVELAVSKENTKRANAPSIAERTAMIPISGSLSYEKQWLNSLCGVTSYQQLIEDVEEMLDLGAKTVVLDQNSGGGECFGCFETANTIKQRCEAAGAHLIAYVDGMSASASYALSCVADEVIMNPMSEAGSIGVLVRLTNPNEAQKKAGYEVTYITSADSKVPFDGKGKFKQDFLEDIQAKVDKLHIEFANHVATHRNISVESINDMQAKVFDADKALELGLADKIMTHEQFFEYLAELEDSNTDMNFKLFKTKAKATAEAKTTEELEAMKLAELQAEMDSQLATLSASHEASVAQFTASLAEAQASLQAKEDELQAALAKLNEVEQVKAQAVAQDKLAKLSAVYGDEEAKELFADLSALPEAAFDRLVAAKKLSNEKLEQSTMFQELGVTAETEQKEEMTQEQRLEARILNQNKTQVKEQK
jgi:ClpP class serine protease